MKSIFLTLSLLLLLSSTRLGTAATITVNDTRDSDITGVCTLRNAIENANNDGVYGSGTCTAGSGTDEIVFAPALSGATITLTSALPDITDDLTITGPGSASLTINANATGRVFNIYSSTTWPGKMFSIAGLALTGGDVSGAGGGGAIYQSGGTLDLTDCIITANQASNGGGIYTYYGTVNISNTTIQNNQATFNPGGGIVIDTG